MCQKTGKPRRCWVCAGFFPGRLRFLNSGIGDYDICKRKDGQARGQYTLEYKIEAVKLVKGGQAVPVTAKILGVPTQTLGNWVRLSDKGQLAGAGDKPVSQEQMELARLRAELSRVKMERDILKKATAYFARESL